MSPEQREQAIRAGAEALYRERYGFDVDHEQEDAIESYEAAVVLDALAPLLAEERRAGAEKALLDAAHALDLGQTKPHTREDAIGAAGAPDWLRARADQIAQGQP